LIVLGSSERHDGSDDLGTNSVRAIAGRIGA
jgi:hypothetical protein